MIHPEHSDDLSSSLSTKALAGQIDKLFFGQRYRDFIHLSEGDLYQPTTVTLGGRLFGYDAKHSVGVQLDSCVYEHIGLVRRVEIVDDISRGGAVRESFAVTDDQVVDLSSGQLLDEKGLDSLSFWLEETHWNRVYTEELSRPL